ncbi:nitroreductase family protein [Desulfallas sp. Bu1-1]|uniref:nitroreductase family protein n=1 Tax=Desulfallas sp. Bu1-1 TaxID=2787620 RepID=UPI00189EB697|nr:nitroreductase family protein [Desulfallas sp. Bu1-1]MBF7082501.1 nitroreductase family protein [Desulfallas sp. Bu1-1]
MDIGKVVADVINTRVSVRRYLPEMITEEEIIAILEAGRRAPSGENAQPWSFIIVKSEENKKILGQLCKRGSGRHFTGEYVTRKMQERFESLTDIQKRKRVFKKLTSGDVSAFVAEAPVLIIVIGLKNVLNTPYDCSAAIENMLIMAHAMGLGGCWVNASTLDIRDEVMLKNFFEIPNEYKVISIIAFGKPRTKHKPRPRKPLEQMVYKEKYGIKYFIGGEGCE